jgi:hypothetical protein
MADYFGLSYPHELTPAALLLIVLILLRVNCGGGVLLQSSTDGNHFEFQIVIPASYKIIARDVGTATGMLDGEQYEGKGALAFRGHPHLGANVYRTRPRGLLGAGRQSPLQTDRV